MSENMFQYDVTAGITRSEVFFFSVCSQNAWMPLPVDTGDAVIRKNCPSDFFGIDCL